MKRKEYSAGMTSTLFWFSEFRKVVVLIHEGRTMNDIKQLSYDENIFAAPSKNRATRILNTISIRLKALNPEFYQLFLNSDISTQKLINLISIMKTDSLFFDFIYEVYREKLIIGNGILSDSDIRIFLNNKQIQSEIVAGWQESTFRRLVICYKGLLMEAGLTDRAAGDRRILRPLLDRSLEYCLKDNDMEIIINALTGVR